MGTKVDYDAIIVGAGFAGLALIHHLKKLGISLKVFDKASGIGGTWNWNKYPGAATDSEGYYYCLSFSKRRTSPLSRPATMYSPSAEMDTEVTK